MKRPRKQKHPMGAWIAFLSCISLLVVSLIYTIVSYLEEESEIYYESGFISN